MSQPARSAQRVRLLVAEDEWLIVMRIERALAGSRYEVAAKAASVAGALATLAAARFDAAILDGNLGGEPTHTLARRLQAVGTPFLLLTAYHPGRLHVWSEAPWLGKPFKPAALLAWLDGLSASGRLDPPHPGGRE